MAALSSLSALIPELKFPNQITTSPPTSSPLCQILKTPENGVPRFGSNINRISPWESKVLHTSERSSSLDACVREKQRTTLPIAFSQWPDFNLIPCVPGLSQMPDVPLLSSTEVFKRLKEDRETREGKQQFMAMYSSIFGGITTDPTTMVIPIDDHMVHRGHGVFDTAAIMDGHLYELDQHVDRFLRSASMAKIPLPFDRKSIRSILIQTVSASKCRQGSLRYWLSVGPGDFQLSPSDCKKSALYAIVIQYLTSPNQEGVKVFTSTVPIKPPQFATMKSVNYLPNALSKMEAEEKGGFASIWLDEQGYIAEGPNMNVAFVTNENELLMPSFDKILSGCTAKRVLSLSESLVREGKLSGIKVGNVGVEEGKRAREMMLIGSGILVLPVLQWDEQIIGNGKEGPVAHALLNLILEDMKSGPFDVRVPVPY